MNCLACKYPEDYQFDSLDWMRKNEKICEKHLKVLESMENVVKTPLKQAIPYVLKPVQPFLPPIAPPHRDYTETGTREPGEEG